MMMSESIWDEVDELPATFHERKLLSESFLKRALKGLLIEIIERKILKPPYGRPDQPNPLVKLSDFLESGGLIESNEDANNDDPLFSYDYGFDPLQYLADYMRFLHPDNIRKIKDEHRSAANQLASQANHARKVLLNFDHLKKLATRLRSGIIWGPFTSPCQSSVSSTSDVLCACRVAKCGNLIVEISKDSQFLLIDKSWSQAVSNEDETQKVHLTSLDFGKSYYLRCHLEINSLQNIPAMEPQLSSNNATERVISVREDCGSDIDTTDHYYQYCGFTTFPPHVDCHVVEVSRQVEVIKLIALNINTQYITVDSIKEEARSPMDVCLTTCILGGLHAPLSKIYEEIVVSNDTVDLSESYLKQTFDMHRHLESFGDPNSILRNSALLIAWHDRSKNSDIYLSEEETSIKKYVHDMRKYNLKYGIGKSKSMQRLPGLATQGPSAPPKLPTTVMSAELNSVLQVISPFPSLSLLHPFVYLLWLRAVNLLKVTNPLNVFCD